jgi:hypothetical protein
MRQKPTTSRVRPGEIGRGTLLGLGWAALLLSCISLAPAAARAQTAPKQASASPDTIGRLSGDQMTVTGGVNLVTANGRSTALLSSGASITLPIGQAKIELVDGGEIDICAPAHLTLLKSGGAITVALDYGRVHAQLYSDVPLTVYTPLIVATPVAIGKSLRDITIGLDQKDVMCALAELGAARIQQQFSGQAILLPQGGELSLTGGQLDGAQMGSQGCQCEQSLTREGVVLLDLRAPIAPPNRPAGAAPMEPTTAAPIETAGPFGLSAAANTFSEFGGPEDANNGFETRVDMPALTFGASSPAPPPGTDQQTMLLVSEIRVQPGAIYQGVVAPAATSSSETLTSAAPGGSPSTAQTPVPPAAKHQAKLPKPGFWARHFGGHKSAPRCAGVGCSSSD